MIAVDTNILVYAHRRDSPHLARARAVLTTLAEGTDLWAIPWPCLHEFLATVTKRRFSQPATPLAVGVQQLRALLDLPNLVTIAEGPSHLEHLSRLVISTGSMGGAVHDARIAALCVEHGVTELWTADRGFGRFSGLTIRNPLLEP